MERTEHSPREGTRRRLIAAKAGRSGTRDTASRIEEIIREGIGTRADRDAGWKPA